MKMLDEEKIMEHLLSKYGYKTIRRGGCIKLRYPSGLNKRIRKAVDETYYNIRNDDAKDYSKVLTEKENTIKFMLEFIKKHNLEQEYKKECLKELIL